MDILTTDLALVPLADLVPHPRNPRQGDVGAIHESIARNGFYGALVVQRSTGHILAGNHRYMAAKQAGATELPVTYVDVDDDTALRILLADNRTSDLATNDPAVLSDLLKDILATQGSLEGTGYDGDALDELLADLAPSDEPMAGADAVREQWMILVECADEMQQTMLLDRFAGEGIKCRPLIS